MLQAGFARVDITPPLGTVIAGYYFQRYAKGVLDPLELNALALSDGETEALIVACDMVGIREDRAAFLREKIAARVGIPADRILLAALHQHTSIYLGDAERGAEIPPDDADYLDFLYRKFCDVAQMAVADRSEASFGVAEEQTARALSFVRRYRMKDGTIKTNPGFKHRAEIDRPMGEADNTVRLWRFCREGKNDIALVNFSTHPDVVSGEKFSADWPGFTRRFVEADLKGVSCVFINGAQGDTNHIDFLGWKEGPNTAEQRYAHSRLMGREVADAVLRVWDKTEARENCRIAAGIKTVLEKTRTDGEEFYDECREVYEDCEIKGNKGHPSASGISQSEAYRIVFMRTAPLFQKIPVTVIAVGDAALVGFGGEPFTHYAAAVRENFPGKYIMAACCANGYEDYLPTRAAFEEGGYETGCSPYPPSLEEDCVAAATALLKQLNS